MRKIQKVAVVGGGMMGRGIAACLAAGGADVTITDVSPAAIGAAVAAAEELVTFLRTKVLHRTPGRVKGAASVADAVGDADAVFEAVFEDMKVKQATFRELSMLTGPEVPLCTNTSSLSVSEIARAVDPQGRSRVLAAHFIGPAHLMPLVEVCPAETTSGSHVDRVVEFLRGCGKKPTVLRKEVQGFIAARLQAALYREALNLYALGVADKAAIDEAVVNGFGRRLNQIGPFTVADFAGVDLVQKTHGTFFPTLGAQLSDLEADKLAPVGRTGVKSGHGHFEWPDAKAKLVAQQRDEELLRRLQADFNMD